MSLTNFCSLSKYPQIKTLNSQKLTIPDFAISSSYSLVIPLKLGLFLRSKSTPRSMLSVESRSTSFTSMYLTSYLSGGYIILYSGLSSGTKFIPKIFVPIFISFPSSIMRLPVDIWLLNEKFYPFILDLLSRTTLYVYVNFIESAAFYGSSSKFTSNYYTVFLGLSTKSKSPMYWNIIYSYNSVIL